jgi:exodeoxyribonuclease III
MRIATFNINGIKARLPALLNWLVDKNPDVVCLQELKAPQDRFPAEAIHAAGYGAIWQGQSRWNGVAILARDRDPVETRRVLPGDHADDQSRYIEAAVDGVVVACLYAPNGNPQPGPKFDYKLAWMDRLHEHAENLRTANYSVVLAGDFNVIPEEIDAYRPDRWVNDALFQPEVRERYRRLLTSGWLDAIRHLHPEEPMYTFWDYWRDAYARDDGIRIDHLLLNEHAADRLVDAGVDRATRGCASPSDHAPAWVVIK